MAFSCTYPGVRRDAATRLTAEVLAAKASEFGLTPAYVVTAVEVQRRRWRRDLVNVVVHVKYGTDVLHPQFPDEAKLAVTAAVKALLGDD